MNQFDLEIIQIVKATAEIYGRAMTDAAATMFLADLATFKPEMIKGALSKCRKELRTFPTVADVIARIQDGRPGVEEAWAMIPKTEYESVVWNDEIAQAYGICRGLIEEDPIAARMAFKESYLKITAEKRNQGAPLRWFPSFGFDESLRACAIQEALAKGRISTSQGRHLLSAWTPLGTPSSPHPLDATHLEKTKSIISGAFKKISDTRPE